MNAADWDAPGGPKAEDFIAAVLGLHPGEDGPRLEPIIKEALR